MFSEQANFKVDVENAAGIYHKINNPGDRPFSIGAMDTHSDGLYPQDLFGKMNLDVHGPSDEPNYYLHFQAHYQDPENSHWTPEQLEALKDLIRGNDPKLLPRITDSLRGYQPGILIRDDSQRFAIGTQRLSGPTQIAFEIFIIAHPSGLLSVDEFKGGFIRKVYGWGRTIENIINSATQVKQTTQRGIFRIGIDNLPI